MSLTIASAFSDIADAIRAKTGKSDTMTPAEMPTEIGSISTGSQFTKIQEGLTIRTNINVTVYEEE